MGTPEGWNEKVRGNGKLRRNKSVGTNNGLGRA